MPTTSPAEMASKTRLWLRVAQTGHFALLAWVILWHSLISPPLEFSPWFLTIAWALPLLFPIKGILQQKPYTFAWANFVLLLYFLHSLTLVYVDEGERMLAIVEVLLTSIAFIGNTLYSRLRGRELGLKLKKLSEYKQEEQERFGRER
ncbi:DUF2069 domain-containing protein [Vibrio breoganii]|uniref:DUF2069 domain-containing protein n=1 Tax=Vibrio breoganii TaxID=553239 RepID=A0ABX1U9S5_9VIBR|nr:DUF2069 domain-containing protein [Vibrio breoganii]NMO72281.1 DUF2069 domain-containing protein [Vibrio breoganii]NMR69772.1 DUF2069 domain-containing protein [Vibrio breoganii]OED98042.1 hypothetical protein A1QG_10845 [Vibrio breoganii ZF-29]OEF88047.1 hypothetical protein B003_14070 [Vibrio breoganii 1C10]PMF76260.1 hypothetical protein BCV08_00500 [Vibrio breoganii]